MLKINTKEQKYQTKFTNVNSFVNVCSERTQQVLHVSSSANKINLILMDGENVLAYLRRNSIFGLTNSSLWILWIDALWKSLQYIS